MTSPKIKRRRRRRAMLARRRRFTTHHVGRFEGPHDTIVYHEIPRMTDHGNGSTT